MAGSWQHMTTRSGRLRDNESFCGMIENLGDAYEAAEECFGMVWYLARLIAVQHRDDPARQNLMDFIEQARVNYREGLREGGVSRR